MDRPSIAEELRAVAMQAAKDAGAAMGMYVAVSEYLHHKMESEDVKDVVETVIGVAHRGLKKTGSFQLGGRIKLRLECKKDKGEEKA